MNIRRLVTLVFLIPVISSGQSSDNDDSFRVPRHYIGLNPLNILFFQQAGLTYEFKTGRFGAAVTAGYIYANHKEYSNYFIAGPTLSGSLGDYSGWFAVPQFNFYLNKPKRPNCANLFYLSLKGVYKHMEIDSTQSTAWSNEGDGYYLMRKMNDNVSIYGGFLGAGYRYVRQYFFFDFNLGFGVLAVDHDMLVSAQWINYHGIPYYFHPPRTETLHESNFTVNFAFTLGVAL